MGMKTFFIAAKADVDVLLEDRHMRQLPQKIGLVSNIQHAHKLGGLKEQLEKAGRAVTVIRGFHSRAEGQVYGCDFPAAIVSNDEIDALLFVGTGRFHPRGMFAAKKPVFIYDPLNRLFFLMDPKDAGKEERKAKVAMLKFLHATEVGVLVSTKPGQLHLKAGEALKRIYPGKNFYFLVCDTLDFTELANFTFIECFVNTACPRLMEDYDKFEKPIINIEEVMQGLSAKQKELKSHRYPLYTQVV
ncbi:diphthamide synthesis protein [Candidatus Woesearchaeota archaeon]|nr:diphthamide synthesis protein [Candidatus Woesearchaeota archaeon]